jgi:NAD(P)-dependent dehydrogenase (short-subunit alcohol dehydrogenase family)
MKLKDKVAIITGGTEGIGRAVAVAYLEEGAKVAVCSRDKDKVRQLHSELTQHYSEVLAMPCNITKVTDIVLLYEQVLKTWGKIDVLVNNAAILGERAKLEHYPDDDWKNVINIDINGVFFSIKNIIPIMKKQKSGAIINVSSGVGRRGVMTWGAYSVAKFGVEALTQIAADELSDYNIRVNAINPGATRTKMRATAYPNEDPNTLPTPSAITPVFVYLASDQSSSINGQSLEARDYMHRE